MIGTTSNVSAAEVLSTLEGLKLTISLGLHGVATICVLASVLIYTIDYLTASLPIAVVIVILVFSLVFNLSSAVLLFLFTPPRIRGKSRAIFGCAIMSTAIAVYTVAVTAVFIKIPSKKGGAAGAAEAATKTGASTQPPPPPPPPPPP